MSTPRARPLPALMSPSVRIVASPIALGWRYIVAPKGRGKVTAFSLNRARETARRYSRRVFEIGPAEAFRRRGTG
jgi:hypothetical protein